MWIKSQEIAKKNIQLIHIFEDEWYDKQDVVKSVLLAKMNKITERIQARKSVVSEVEPDVAKQFLFDNLPSCICCYLSPSRKGVKALVRIGKCYSVEEYKSYIYALGYYFEKYEGWDGSCQSPILCLFLSWDKDLLFRENASVFSLRGGKRDEFKKYEGIIEPLENVTQEQTDKVKAIFSRGIENIVDNAYPTMRGLCLALGGFSGFGYISIEDAEELVKDCISDNEYMSKNTKHYIKNGIEFLHKGVLSPLPLKEDE
jgi:hypothetical protein